MTCRRQPLRFRRCVSLVLASLALIAVGACEPPPYVTLRIGVDRQSVPEDVTTIGIGVASETEYRLSRQLTVADVNRLRGGELTVTITSESGTPEALIVEGLRQGDTGFEIIGRDFVTVNFGDEITKDVTLRRPCDGPDHPKRSSDVDERCGGDVAVCNGRTQACESQVCTCPESFCGDSFTDVGLGEECDDGNLNPNDGCDRCAETIWNSSVVLGLGSSQGDPRALALEDPVDVATGANGVIYVADELAGRVWRVQDDRVSLFAGNGRGVYSEDDEGRPAALAAVERPTALAVDGFNRVFIAESVSGGFNARVRVVDDRGIISTFASTDEFLVCPRSLAAAQDGTLYIGDCDDVVWWVPPGADRPERFAGTGEFEIPETIGDGGLATLAYLEGVAGIATDGRGRVFITEEFGNRIRVVENGRIATITGSADGFGGFGGDGAPARSAQVYGPTGILVDGDGSIVFSDSFNYRIRSIGLDGVIETIAGNGVSLDGGDGVLAIESSFGYPYGIARSSDGALLIADAKARKLRSIAPGTPLMSTVVGLGQSVVGGDDGLATSATFRAPAGLALSDDALFIADPDAHRVRALTLNDGVIRAYAGTGELDGRGESTLAGDGDSATAAQLNQPVGVAYSPADRSIYIADTSNRRLRRVDESGKIESVVGGGTLPAPIAPQNAKELLVTPFGVAAASDGRVYFSDLTSNAIVELSPDGTAKRIAGTPDGEAVEVDGVALETRLRLPSGLFFDDAENRVVFVDETAHLVREVDLDTGVLDTLAGGLPLLEGAHGDGYAPYLDFVGAASRAWLGGPSRVATGADGTVYLSDRFDHRIREIDTDGTIRVIAGSGQDPFFGGARGFNGDNIPATSALLDNPEGLCVNNDTLYFADRYNHRIRTVSLSSGLIETIAGNPEDNGFGFNGAFGGDDGPAIDAQFFEPSDVVYRRGTLLVADTYNGRIRKIDLASGIVETFAGGGVIDPISGPQAREAMFTCPTGLAVGPDDSVFVAEACVHRVWRIDSLSGTITHIAGTGSAGSAGDGGSARAAQLQFPIDLAVATTGEIYLADEGNHRIRVIGIDGRIRSFTAPAPAPSFGGDGRGVIEGRLAFPGDVEITSDGSLLIADAANNRIRKVSPPIEGNPTITTIAGAAAPGDGGDASDAIFHFPTSIVPDDQNGYYVADAGHYVVRYVDVAGRVRTVAGTGAPPKSGEFDEGRLGTETRLTGPTGLALRNGTLFISDGFSERVRALDLDTGLLTTAAGLVDPGSGTFESARLDLPNAMVDVDRGLFVAQGDGRIRFIDETTRQVKTVVGVDGAVEGEGAVAADQARLFRDAAGVAYDSVNQKLFVTERDGHGIRVITIVDPGDESTWTVADFVGAAESPDHVDGPLDRARFKAPSGLAFHDETQTLFVADTGNHVVRAIDTVAAEVITVVGVPEELGDAPDNAQATTANLNAPQGVAISPDGILYVADTGNHVVRRVRGTTVTRVLGDGQPASSGEGRPARNFPVDAPQGLRLDGYGNLFVTSRTSIRVVVVEDEAISGNNAVLTVYGNALETTFPEDITSCLSDVVVMGVLRDDLASATSDAELQQMNAGENRVLLVDACQGMLVSVDRTRPTVDVIPDPGPEVDEPEPDQVPVDAGTE